MHPRSFVTTCHPSEGQASVAENWLRDATRVTVFEAVGAASIRLYPPVSFVHERFVFLRECISIVARSVCRDGYILMFINCPRGQRNYFVNHRRGKMMLGTVCQLSSRYSCSKVERGSGGGPRSSFFIFARLIRGVKGVVSIKHHQPPLFRFTCVEARPFAFPLFCSSRGRACTHVSSHTAFCRNRSS